MYDPLTHAGPLVAALIGVPAVRHLFGPDITYHTRYGDEVPQWTALLRRLGLNDPDLNGDVSVDPCPPSLQLPTPVRRIRTGSSRTTGSPRCRVGCRGQSAGAPRICLTWGTSTDRLVGRSGFVPDDVLSGCVKLADERGAELIVAITAGQRHLLPSVLPANVHIVQSVPLDVLLPTCQAMIHQGGPGTMLTALRHGLPQVTVTHLVDQTANAVQLVAAGAGLTMRAVEVSAAALLAAGHELLDDPAYRAAAHRLKKEMLELPAPAEVVADLTALIR